MFRWNPSVNKLFVWCFENKELDEFKKHAIFRQLVNEIFINYQNIAYILQISYSLCV